jgi:hypothetical protein
MLLDKLSEPRHSMTDASSPPTYRDRGDAQTLIEEVVTKIDQLTAKLSENKLYTQAKIKACFEDIEHISRFTQKVAVISDSFIEAARQNIKFIESTSQDENMKLRTTIESMNELYRRLSFVENDAVITSQDPIGKVEVGHSQPTANKTIAHNYTIKSQTERQQSTPCPALQALPQEYQLLLNEYKKFLILPAPKNPYKACSSLREFLVVINSAISNCRSCP